MLETIHPTNESPGRKQVLIADDEPLARRGIRQLLAPHADMVVAGECRNGRETLWALDSLAPDLLFLDIRMPEMDGFEVLRARNIERLPAIVFVTAHDDFAVRAFEAHAIDYLLKPLNAQRFEASLQRVRERFRMIAAVEQAARLAALLRERQAQEQGLAFEVLVIPSETGELVIPLQDVDWIAADDYYSRVHVGPKSHLLRESLSSLEARLDQRRFIRVHRSAMVTIDRIRELRTTLRGHEVVLATGWRVPVSRRKRAHLEALLHELRNRTKR